MNEQVNLRFPLISIKSVKPLLSQGPKVFAYQIEALTEDGNSISIYENKGLDLREYIGAKMECLLEITRGELNYKKELSAMPENALVFKYLWIRRLHEFFPELMKIRESLSGANNKEEVSLKRQFETAANTLFTEWGLNGLGVEIYQDKPLLSCADGFYLLNEYEFEDEIDALELGQEVYIKIEEAFLRGIRPCATLVKPGLKQERAQEKQKEECEPKKRRLLF